MNVRKYNHGLITTIMNYKKKKEYSSHASLANAVNQYRDNDTTINQHTTIYTESLYNHQIL